MSITLFDSSFYVYYLIGKSILFKRDYSLSQFYCHLFTRYINPVLIDKKKRTSE